MKYEEFEVKAKGVAWGKVKVPVYESLDEATKAGIDGVYTLQAINRCVRKDQRDQFYASKTQSVSVIGQARKVIKGLSDVQKTAMQKEMELLMKKYGATAK